MLRVLPILVSVLAAVGGLIGLWINVSKWRQSEVQRKESERSAARQRRDKELRIKDVLLWSNEVISKMVSLRICIVSGPEKFKTTIERIMFDTSILLERGRLFFRNDGYDDHENHQYSAYQGRRPTILDQILIAHYLADRVASGWSDADEKQRRQMQLLARHCLRRFVSLAQKEVGRSVVASVDAAKGGSDIDLDYELDQVEGAPSEAALQCRSMNA